MEEKLSITWLGHSCFKLESHGYSVILDPYEDGKVPGLKPLRAEANQVLCSHDHKDHNYRDAITLKDEDAVSPFQIQEMITYHDEEQGKLRGMNTIRILDDGNFRVAHLGDLGCDLEPVEMLKGLDVMMIPVGGYYTIDAAQARQLVEHVNPRVVIPMHYQGLGFGYDELSSLNTYLELCQNVIRYHRPDFVLTKNNPLQTAVLTCKL